jgi:DNA-binding response OmpR family regulator
MAAERVFIVEDDVDMVEALRLPLEAHGYRVFQAGSAREALGRVGEVNPDLIILDVMMESDTAGFQMAYQLRNPAPDAPYARYSKVPILMLTAIGSVKRMKFSPETDGDFLPVDAYLEKPILPEMLLERVAALLKKGGRA